MSQPIPKPAPVVVTTVCSLCDEPWEAHGDDPTTADCIRLLKARIVTQPVTPVVIYRDRWPWYPNQYPTITYPSYTPQWTYTAGTTVSGTTNNVIEFRSPRDDDGPTSVRV